MDNDTMDPIDGELRDVLHGMIATPDVEPGDAVTGVQRRVVRRRRNRRVLTAASLVSVVVLATVAGVAIADGSDSKRHVNVTASSTVRGVPAPKPIVTDPGGVQSFGKIPLATRSGSANVWTGSEFVVWGGSIESANAGLPGPDRQFNDGAAFDPATRKWRTLSASPLPARRGTSFGVATDAGVVFTSGRATALWNPTDDTWRLLGDAPADVDDLAFTGTSVISASAHAILDPATGAWRAIAPLPNLDRKAVAWTGAELFVIGGPGSAFTSAVAYAYDPAGNAWRRLADPPARLHAEALAADWDGKRVVVVNYDMQAHTYDPATNTWKVLPSVPARFSEWSPYVQSSGGRTVVFMAATVAVLNAADEWTPLPYDPIPAIGQLVAADDGAVFAIGWPRDEKVNVLTAIDLDRLTTSPERLQVGVATVRLPGGYTIRDTAFSGGAPIGSDDVRVVLANASGSTCTLTSSYGNPDKTITSPVTESLVNDGVPHEWQHDGTGRSWRSETSPGDIDSVAVRCDDAATARAIATSLSWLGK